MPLRTTPLVTDYYYHLFNRSVAQIPIFTSKQEFSRAIDLLNYYQYDTCPVSFSRLKRLNLKMQSNIWEGLKKDGRKRIDVLSFCLLPNHFHLLVKQNQEEGISQYLRIFQNSYAKYFNTKNDRTGPVYQNRFKAVLIENDHQLLHVSRYIHLNPYTSLLIKKKAELREYPWSSLPEYLGKSSQLCQREKILGFFQHQKAFLDFVMDQADYQRTLAKIKHLVWE